MAGFTRVILNVSRDRRPEEIISQLNAIQRMHSRFDRTAYTCIVVERGTPGASTCIEHVLRHRASAEVGFGLRCSRFLALAQ